MAHVVGVPKRDPCQKCQMPVFLAERLAVGKKIYHRTCLKCARCGSQLTPGSFYETEVDDEYCCETCPDEDLDAAAGASNVLLRRSASPLADNEAAATANISHTVRSSIADRLAFFEHSKIGEVSDSKLLQKSVSDEEKSKSLKRLEAGASAPATTSTYKMNSALSSFLKYDDIDAGEHEAEAESEPTSTTASKSETQMESSDTDDDIATEDDASAAAAQPSTLQPALPKTAPPAEPIKAAETPTPTKRFTATAQLQLSANQTDSLAEQPTTAASTSEMTKDTEATTERMKLKKTEVQFNLATTNDNANNNINHDDANKTEKLNDENEKSTHLKLTQDNSANNLDLSHTNDNNKVNDHCVTKEINADSNTNTNADTTAVEEKTATTSSVVIADDVNTKTSNATTTIEQIKSELHELETESSTDLDEASMDESAVEMRAKTITHKQQHATEDVATTERLSVVRARLQQFEVIANNKDNNSNNSTAVNLTSPEKINANVRDKINLSDNSINTNNTNLSAQLNENIKTEKSMQQINVEEEEKEAEKMIEESVHEMELETIEEETPSTTTLTKLPESFDDDDVDQEKTPSTTTLTKLPESLNAVPLETRDDNINVVNKQENNVSIRAKEGGEEIANEVTTAKLEETSAQTSSKTSINEYNKDLNPFKSDDDDDDDVSDDANNSEANKENRSNTLLPPHRASIASSVSAESSKKHDSNPFDSSDDEIELEKSHNSTAATTPSSATSGGKIPPPRPPPPRISRNPFGDESEDDAANFSRRSSVSSSLTKKTPVPTPRTNLSQNPTPEPTPRLSNKGTPQAHAILQNSSEYYGSANSLGTPQSMQRNSDVRGSNNSLTSSAGGTVRMRKSRKAPAPPAPVKELFASSETIDSSKTSTPNSSTKGTPKMGRKKRPAPAPPKPARLEAALLSPAESNGTLSKNLHSYPLQSELDSKLSDEEKALLEGKPLPDDDYHHSNNADELLAVSNRNSRRLIPLGANLLADEEENDDGTSKCDDVKEKQQRQQYQQQQYAGKEEEVVYRRVLIPPTLETPTHESNPLLDDLNAAHDRQLEKLKDNKEAQNRNRQSQLSASSGNEDCDPLYNKSSHGKWKRRKGPAPALPIPPRKVLQMLPLQEIRHELEIIEVQQQGLEKQGVILEKMIRDRCEGQNGEPLSLVSASIEEDAGEGVKRMTVESAQNSKEVEDLILQLFELVNEKNELFRRQAELMYLRRQHRLEQEQADLEYEIRVLMAQPERNKTDTDKAREEALIARLVEVVQLRNDVIDCLEMDRLREAEEDLSIKQRLELHSAKRESDDEHLKKSNTKLSKKEKKKQKEAKKLSKSRKIDADKDADETELNADQQKIKKKKKKFLF